MKKFLSSCLIVFLITVAPTSASNTTGKTFTISKSLSIFNSVLRELDMYYVDSLQHEKLVKTALDNMLATLDPYTVYIPESETDDISFMTTGEYGGIGSIITKTRDGICIADPYEGMPAQKNGLRAGDILLEIDGESTDRMTVSEASSKLKGTPNTEIKLKVKRYGQKKSIVKTFQREKIVIHPITYSEVVAPGIAYILLSDFTENAAIELKNTLREMTTRQGVHSLILDLRNNGGGLIDEAVKIMGFFVPKGTEIVSTRGKSAQSSYSYKTTVEPTFPDMKITMLVNSASASASEILAGALQDLDRGVVIGERTFGKGLVQNIRPVGYGGHVKITTAKYYIPSGRCIQAIDYAQRDEEGRITKVPDSLTNTFRTQMGRIVKDGGGIIPDSITSDKRTLNIAYYIFAQNLYFDYATRFAANRTSIGPAKTFRLSDQEFEEFARFLDEVKFSYTPQTKKYFDDLYNFAKFEGLDKEAATEFEALKAKLLPDTKVKLYEHRSEIEELLSAEIIKRYYYQKGVIEFSLQNDTDLQAAIQILTNQELYTHFFQKEIRLQ
ncbi:MAG: S41 family peptidase [Paludibacter sp.]|jgi:carboxyl-terminal processing protease|nr:S41 family peptidase [Paludibacter sp.]